MMINYAIGCIVAFFVIYTAIGIISDDPNDCDYGKCTLAVLLWPLTLLAGLGFVYTICINVIFGKK